MRGILVALLVVVGCSSEAVKADPPSTTTSTSTSTTTSSTTTTLDPMTAARAAYFSIASTSNQKRDDAGAPYEAKDGSVTWAKYPAWCKVMAPLEQEFLTAVQGYAWPPAVAPTAAKLVTDQAALVGYYYDCASRKPTYADLSDLDVRITANQSGEDSSALRAVLGLPIFRE